MSIQLIYTKSHREENDVPGTMASLKRSMLRSLPDAISINAIPAFRTVILLHLHIRQLSINLLVQECSLLPRQFCLQSLLD